MSENNSFLEPTQDFEKEFNKNLVQRAIDLSNEVVRLKEENLILKHFLAASPIDVKFIETIMNDIIKIRFSKKL